MATNSKQVKPLDIPFKEFMPGQVIQSVQFNDDMRDIEDTVNELVNEHNIVSTELSEHVDNLNNPHQVDAHQTGTYNASEIDEFFQDVKSGNLNDNAITNRVLDDDCVTARNIEDNTITVSKVDSMLGSQLDISQNIEIATRYTKEETDNLIQEKVGNGTYSKEQLDVKFEEIQAGVIVDSTIGIEKLKEDVGKKLNISGNINILNRYTKDEVDYLIKTNALPHDWGSVLDEVDNDVLPFLDTRNGIFPVADYMIADKFVSPSDQILDFDIREVVVSRGEYETLNDRLNVYDTIKPEISVELDAITNKINDNQKINNDEHDIIDNKIVENKSKITALNDRMFNLENNVSGNNSKISNLERRADSLESRATALESADRGINIKISNVENRLGNIDTLNNTQTSKINTLENRANTTDTYISNINTNINTVKNDLNNVKSDLDTVKEDLSNVGQIVNENIEPIRNQLSQVVSKNNEQDSRLSSIEDELNGLPDVISNHNDMLEKHKSEINDIKYVNKRQDVMLGGLFNENADGRLNIDGTGNDVKLEGSKDGLVEVNKVVGNTMVNVCDQKDPVAITKSYTVESGNHVALQGDYDGKCRPVVYGNTLVNLSQINEATLTANKSSTTNLSMIKPSTTYTRIIIVVKNTLSPANSSGDVAVIDEHLIGSNVSTLDRRIGLGFTGIIQFTFTTPSDLSGYDICEQIRAFTISTEGELVIKDLLLEGDYTNKPIPDFFTGMQSSFEDKVVTQEMVDSGKELAENLGKYKVEYKVTGKNKLNLKNPGLVNVPNGYIIDNNTISFNIGNETYRDIRWFIKVKPGTKYTLSYSDYSNGAPILYDEKLSYGHSNTYIPFNVSNKKAVFTPKSEFITFRLSSETYKNSTVSISNVQIEEGDTNTAYEPYKEQVKTYYLNSPLLEGDTIEDNGNDVFHVHRYGKRIFDGSEDWRVSSAGASETLNSFSFGNAGGTPSINTAICDKMICKGMWYYQEEGIWLDENCIITVNNTKAGNVSEFKTYLSNNPLTVVYQLASPQYELISTNDTILTDSYVNGHLDFDTVVPVEKVKFNGFGSWVNYLYPSTEYIVQFESDNVGKISYIGLNWKSYCSGENVVKGINKFRVLIDSTINSGFFELSGIGFNASNIVVTEATDKDFGYFSGMKSVFEDKVTEDGKYKAEVKVVGKNKFDNVLYSGWVTDNGVEFNKFGSKDNILTDFIKVRPNTKYVTNKFNYAWLFDSNKNKLSQVISPTLSFDSGNASYIIFGKSISLKDIPNFDTSNVQIEEGTQLTLYEPYKEYVHVLYLDEPLYKDNELCVHDGKLGYWKKFEKVVLDGSEEGWGGIEDKGQFFKFSRGINNAKYYLGNSHPLLCDKLPTNLFLDETQSEQIAIFCHTNDDKELRVNINKGKLSTLDIDGAIKYLSQNPVTVVYQLAEPVFVPILENTPQWVLESFNDCSIHFNSNIPITSSNLSYTGNVPSVYSMERTNQIQDDLIDVSLMATDEMFVMLEPLLNAIPETINMKGNSKMVDMYVAMVMRGLKTIEEIPARYREEVKKVLDKLEK